MRREQNQFCGVEAAPCSVVASKIQGRVFAGSAICLQFSAATPLALILLQFVDRRRPLAQTAARNIISDSESNRANRVE
jgi:hypothetical protein